MPGTPAGSVAGLAGHRQRRHGPSRRELGRRALVPLLFLAPMLALLAVFRLLPIGRAFWLSFTDWDGLDPPGWVGLANYRRLLHDEVFRKALVNNGLILLAMPVWVLLPLVVAVLLHQRIPGWRLFRLAFFLPAVLSPVIIGAFFEVMLRYDGPVNAGLRAAGLGAVSREWLADPATALPAMMAILIWATFGTGVLIFLAGLATVDQELYDAATVDGAGWWQAQRAVTLPQLRPIVEFYAVISVIASFASFFPYVYTLTRGGPGYATYVVEYDVYEQGFGQGALGYGSAVGTVLFLVVLALVLGALSVTRRREVLR